jgi:DNA-binding MarR family transcriptional regulator
MTKPPTPDNHLPEDRFSDHDYRAIAAFRARLREFLRFSEESARSAGISPQQHQLLLAVRGYEGTGEPTIGELAEALQIRHNSCVGLIDRMEGMALVQRLPSPDDARKVLVRLTPDGQRVLAQLTDAHQREYRQLHDVIEALLAIERESAESADNLDERFAPAREQPDPE